MSRTAIRMNQKTQPNPANNNQNSKPKNNRRNRRRRQSYRRRRMNIRQTIAPLTVGTTSKIYSNLTQRGNSARLDFCELFPIQVVNNGISCLILINPAKWISTRTYDQARLYTQFRPQYLNIEFISNVATSTPGLVSFGSYYANSHPDYTSDLFLRLPQTEGGFISSVWQSCRSKVRCGTALSQNKYALQEVTDEDIPVSLVFMTNATNLAVGSIVGYCALSGAFILTGPRTTKEEQNVSGTYQAQVQINDGKPEIVVEDQFHCFVPDQEVMFKPTAVTEGQQLLLANGLSVDWKKIFKVFVNVLGKVVSVVGTVVKIAVAVAPIILAEPVNGVLNTGTTVNLEMIGKLTKGSVDVGDDDDDQPEIQYTSLIINYPSGKIVDAYKPEDNFVRFSTPTNPQHITFTLDHNVLSQTSDYSEQTESYYITTGDTNTHAMYPNSGTSSITLEPANYKIVIAAY